MRPAPIAEELMPAAPLKGECGAKVPAPAATAPPAAQSSPADNQGLLVTRHADDYRGLLGRGALR